MNTIGILSRSIACVVAVFCFWISLSTTDRDRNVQNWLVLLWTNVEEISTNRISKAIALLKESARKINAALNRMFGSDLWSWRFVGTSSIFSIASLYFLTALRYGLTRDLHGAIKYLQGFFLCGLLVNAVIAWPKRNVILVAIIAAAFCLFLTERGLSSSLENAFVGIFVGILLDWGFISAARQTLRKLEVACTLSQAAFWGMLNTLLGFILLAPASLFVSYRLWYILPHSLMYPLSLVGHAEWVITVASATNLIAGLCALSLLFLITMALFHRMFWPIISRVVQVCYERRVVERRMFFFSTGCALLIYSFHWFSWLEKIQIFLH